MASKNKRNRKTMPVTSQILREHTNRRRTVQGDEDTDRADNYIQWYRDSWLDKSSRGLHELYSDIDDAWEGNLNIPMYEEDPGSNMNIIHPTIEGQVALLADERLDIEVDPLTPAEIRYKKPIQTMLEFVKENNDLTLKHDVFVRRLKKYGVGIYRTMFNEDWEDGFGLPEIKTCNPIYVYTDPNIVDIYEIQDGRFIIEAVTKSIAWAERKFGTEKADMIIPNYEPATQSQYFGERGDYGGDTSRQRYIHLFVFEKFLNDKGKLKLKLTQMSACGVILWDSEDENFTFPNSSFPYFFAPC